MPSNLPQVPNYQSLESGNLLIDTHGDATAQTLNLARAWSMRACDWQSGFARFLEHSRPRRKLLTVLLSIDAARTKVPMLDDVGLAHLSDACVQGLDSYDLEMSALLRRKDKAVTTSTVGGVSDDRVSPASVTLDGWMWIGQCLDSFDTFVTVYHLLKLATSKA